MAYYLQALVIPLSALSAVCKILVYSLVVMICLLTFLKWQTLALAGICGHSLLIISPTFFTWVFQAIFKVRVVLIKYSFISGMSWSISAYCPWRKSRSVAFIFAFFLNGNSGMWPILSLDLMSVTWLPSCWFQYSSAAHYLAHGFTGTAKVITSATISMHRAGRRRQSTCFSMWLSWFCRCGNSGTLTFPCEKRSLLCACLALVSCTWFWAHQSLMQMLNLNPSVTLVSILRLNSLIHFASTENLTCKYENLSSQFSNIYWWGTGDYVGIGYWSTIECDVGVICACLPAIRSLLRRVSPKLFGDTEHTKSYGMNSHSRGNGSRFENSIHVQNSFHVQSKSDSRNFYPLDDMENSSQANLH